YRLAEAIGCPQSSISAMVIGAHSDTGMIPLIDRAVCNSIPVSAFLSAQKMSEVVEATKVGGATLTSLLGTSAWYAPGAAVSEMVQAIALDSKKVLACSALLNGEYGLNDISFGVPCVIGKNGIEKIVEFDLSEAEKAKMAESAVAVNAVNALL
ncbi:MAG: malate dehydrogenase, partial [Mangrovibacterium sp.]